MHWLRAEPRILCCCAIRLRCVFTWNYCQQSSNSAINNRCADLLRALSLLFAEKAVAIVHPGQRPHVSLWTPRLHLFTVQHAVLGDVRKYPLCIETKLLDLQAYFVFEPSDPGCRPLATSHGSRRCRWWSQTKSRGSVMLRRQWHLWQCFREAKLAELQFILYRRWDSIGLQYFGSATCRVHAKLNLDQRMVRRTLERHALPWTLWKLTFSPSFKIWQISSQKREHKIQISF